MENRAFLNSIVLYEDADMLVLDKPMGLAVQGGSGTRRHVDGMLTALTDKHGQKPRLVHRLDKDTSGWPRHRQDPVCRGRLGQELQVPRYAQDLLGARGRRAAREAGARIDVPREGRGR